MELLYSQELNQRKYKIFYNEEIFYFLNFYTKIGINEYNNNNTDGCFLPLERVASWGCSPVVLKVGVITPMVVMKPFSGGNESLSKSNSSLK